MDPSGSLKSLVPKTANAGRHHGCIWHNLAKFSCLRVSIFMLFLFEVLTLVQHMSLSWTRTAWILKLMLIPKHV